MIIEIRRAGFVNKGAELMLLAILDRVRAAFPEAIYTMAPTHNGSSQPFRKVVDLGLYPKCWLYYKGVQWGHLANIAPRKLREMYGLILDRDVDIIIDAAGFCYSDQWGEESTLELAQSAARWRKQGSKSILMPQAFGPFTTRRIRKAIARAVDNIDLVMPREKTSYELLTEVTGERPNIRQCPDFTNLIEGAIPEYFSSDKYRVCLIPNFRMVDKTDQQLSREYLPFMIRCALRFRWMGLKPFILVHEGDDDRRLAESISNGAGGVPVIVEDNPLRIKGIIGASFATVSSRYHGIVSSLSQGVPCLGTGWSHKYKELFNDYGFPEGLVSVDESESVLSDKIDRLVNEQNNRQLVGSLHQAAASIKGRSEAMWKEVFSVMDLET